ncbi:hypothetical protein JHN59_34180 [Streptomyces sp. MBT49]|uniref:hypothetical protein n=1 Tax=Streptomyces sp. MBT49 TaxID=1488380 RepID=UPI00190E24F9|nr:hypothetical protein [Streptomyces sp. MBT49]MBK3629770.1 hypothetical protein [Streptomyces sp. MBT49]
MSESVPVRCPVCRSERLYIAPSYPCVCGAPVTPVLDRRTAPTTVAHRAWDDEWVALRCPSCGLRHQWPRPELGCACGAVLRVPVTEPALGPESGPGHGPTAPASAQPPPSAPRTSTPAPAPAPGPSSAPTPAPPRRAFRPVAIRTARDAVTAAALYLNWLGHGDIRRADQRPTAGIGLAARGLVAQVDPSVSPASSRDVECLWLTAMTASADCVYFSLAGYDDDARARADQLCVPLFVLDLTGTPQPVNATAGALDAGGV